jgi:formate hydrogenlyase subunit 3/multisubunit Na+/H+ antiporter MnhD subunit
MTAETLVLLAPCIPLFGALLIGLAGRFPNLREGITLATGLTLLGAVGYLASMVYAGARPEVTLIETMPGLEIAFAIERFKVADLVSLLVAGLCGGGWRIGEAEFLACRVDGGPLAAAQAAARLLKVTFTVAGEDEAP